MQKLFNFSISSTPSSLYREQFVAGINGSNPQHCTMRIEHYTPPKKNSLLALDLKHIRCMQAHPRRGMNTNEDNHSVGRIFSQ